MSSGSMSILDKLKDIFSKIFKGKSTKTSSFKTPQELQRSRYGTAAATTPDTTSPIAGASRPAEISQTPSAPAPASAPVATYKASEPSRASTTATTPTVNNSISRIKEAEGSADVSPTEPRMFRADRPHSGAVSALDQELVSDRVNKTNDAEAIQEGNGLQADRPISDIAPADSVHTAQSPTVPDKREDNAAKQHEQQPATATDAKKIPEPAIEEPVIEEPVVEKSMVEQPMVEDPPEVVNKFDDEKVPVIAEPPAISSPAETKFRMSATSGPLEDFPANGEYYA